MIGTLVNAAAVVIGGVIGLFVHRSLPDRVKTTAFQAIGLFTFFLGVSMAFETNNYLIMILSIVFGSVIGAWVDIDKYVNRFGDYLKRKIGSNNDKFSEGFITSFMLYCMGSMTILGAFEEGLGGAPNLLLSKSVLDGFSSIALAASLGVGVVFSAIPLLFFQGGLTFLAVFLEDFLTNIIISELTSVGGLILIGLAINILEIKKIKILNMLPSLLIVVILSYYFL
jgi:uncharacterized membrane protein YqgA involved in biofilm formation